MTKYKPENVLIIGDIHEPFCLDGYLEFCKETKKKYRCNRIVFIGDIIDNHYASFHDTDPDGLSGIDELERAIAGIAKWVKAFPVADVILGNHDRIIMRKAFAGGVPQQWIRDYADVLEAPEWNFTDEAVYNGVQYLHGEGGTARVKSRKDLMSTVQGHLHPQAYVEWTVGKNFRVFGMQVGCGVDNRAYSMAYAKSHPKPAIACGVVLDDGKQPINVMMEL